MYLPAAFATDTATAYQIIEGHPFASLVTVHDGQAYLTQIPMILKSENTLLGHMARANPHSAALLDASNPPTATVQFTGPNCYVSPAWYEKNSGVPTWNYATVLIKGPLQLIHDAPSTEAVVKALIERFDTQAPLVKQAWAELPNASQAAQLGAILAFEIHITHLSGKTKLSQNRSAQDQARVKAKLNQGNFAAQAVAAKMVLSH